MSKECMTCDAKEAAVYLGIAVRTLYALAGAKKIAHVRIGPNGGKIRFIRSDLDDYLASCRVEVAGAKPVPTRKAKAPQVARGTDRFGWGNEG